MMPRRIIVYSMVMGQSRIRAIMIRVSPPAVASYACCPTEQGLPDNVILANPSTGQLNACLVAPFSDIVNPTNDPTPGPTPGPTPDPTPGPTLEPTN